MSKSAVAVLLIQFSVLVMGCGDQSAKSQLDILSAQEEMEETNKAIVMRWFDEVNTDNFDQLYDEFFAADCLQRMPPNAEPMKRDQFKAMVADFFFAFPDVKHSVRDIVAEGDKVAATVTVHAIHEGDFLGIPATGRELEWTAIAVFTFADGKIMERSEIHDHAGFMSQLGMEFRLKED